MIFFLSEFEFFVDFTEAFIELDKQIDSPAGRAEIRQITEEGNPQGSCTTI